jgi:hypothetical protein
MKNLIVIVIMMSSTLIYASTVPLSWYQPGTQSSDKGLERNQSIQESKFNEELNFIFNTQLNALEENSITEQSQKGIKLPFGFKFSHYVTDFSISKSGIFGFSALKAKSAVEIKWQKKKNKSIDKQTEPNNVLEFTDDSDEHFNQLSKQIIKIAHSSGKIDMTPSAEKKLSQNVHRAMNNFKYMIRSIENKEFKVWDLAAIRLDLNIGATGKIFWVSSAGASVRVRLEWKKVNISKPSNNYKSRINSNLANKILYDLDTLLSEYKIGNFTVDKVNIGVGISRKGRFLGLAKSKAGFMGFLRFKPKEIVKQEQELAQTLDHSELSDEDIEVVLGEDEFNRTDEKGFLFFKLSRHKFRNGIRKSLKMVNFFANAADKKGKNWEVNGLKAAFDLQKSGFLGLSSVTGQTVIEIELKR